MLIEAYLKNKFEIDIITYPVGNDIHTDKLNIYRPKVKFYKKKTAGPSLTKPLIDLFVLNEAIKLCKKNDYDLIHCEDAEAAFIGVILKKLFKKKIISDFHNQLSENFKIHKWNFLVPIAKVIEKFMYKNSDYIIANSDDLKNTLEQKYGLKNIDIVLDLVTNKQENPKIKLPKNYIVYAGNCRPYQGVPLMLKSYAKFSIKYPDVPLVLIGNIDDETKNIIKSLKLEKNTIMTGILTLEKTNYVLSRSIFNLMPRVSGIQPGMKALHYMVNKTPIIATDLRCNTMFLEHLNNAYLTKPDADSFYKGMIVLMKDKNLRAKIKQNIIKTTKKQDLPKKLLNISKLLLKK